jgi:hypothetical protein
VLRQHGQSIRIDSRSEIGRTGVMLLRQVFTRPDQAVTFKVGRFADGRLAFLSLMDDPFTAPPPASLRLFTGETQNRLGEQCRVWRVSRTTTYGNQFLQTGCVTADGAELWRRQANIDAIFATKVMRKPVPPGEVRPPTELLELAKWTARSRVLDHSHDYAVTLEPSHETGPRRTARRSGDWTAVREEHRHNSQLSVMNPAEGIGLQYSRDQNGGRRLRLYRRPVGNAPPAVPTGVRMPDRADEIILGEKCQWWDMMPGVADAGRHECRTADGVTLKVEYISRASMETAVAVGLKRGPQPLSAVMPERELVSAKAWGF